jgi:hypothetical protein
MFPIIKVLIFRNNDSGSEARARTARRPDKNRRFLCASARRTPVEARLAAASPSWRQDSDAKRSGFRQGGTLAGPNPGIHRNRVCPWSSYGLA